MEQGARLITITGPAGVGKTQLAAHVCRGFGDQQQVVFCDVTEARDAKALFAVTARGLGLSSDDPERIALALDAREDLLLVLDNYEQVDADADGWLAQWLRLTSEARLLVTSRRRLRLDGEHTFELAPLDLPPDNQDDVAALRSSPAVRLFVERASMAGASLDDDALAEVAHIVRELDGLPLAVELAAAKTRLLSLTELRQRLHQRFALLRGRGLRKDRPLSLRAALDASWSLLSPVAQQTLAHCSVFVGEWDLAAATALLTLDDEVVVETLEELHDQSLLVVDRSDGTSRFRLYVTVRDYAAEQVDSPDGVRQRHARYFATKAKQLHRQLLTAEGEDALATLTNDLDNAVAAARWLCGHDRALAVELVVALAPVYEVQGPLDAYLSLLDETFAAPSSAEASAAGEALDADLRARALIVKGRALEGLGRAAQAEVVLREALAVAEQGQVAATIASAAIAWGWTCGTRGDDAEANTAFAQAEAALAGSEEPWLEAHLWRRRGYLAYRQGLREQAEQDMRRAAERFRELGARRDEAGTLGWLGFVADGRPERAIPYFRRAVGLLDGLGAVRQLARHLQYLAVFEVEQGELDEASAHFERSISLQRKMADRQQEAVSRSRRAMLYLERREAQLALDELSFALQRLDGESDLLYRGEALALMAAAEIEFGLVEAARGHLAASMAILEPIRYPALDALRLFEAHCDLVAGGADANKKVRAVRDDPAIDHSYALTRVAHRWLVRALGDTPGAELRIAADFAWFEAGDERVSLARRAPMRRLLRALVKALEDHAPLTAAELVETGWPGENLIGTSGEARLYTTIRRLRRLGLAEFIHHDGAGYRLVGRVTCES